MNAIDSNKEGSPISVVTCLCISSMLLKYSNGIEHDLARISKKTNSACKENNIKLLSATKFEQIFPYADEIRSVPRLLKWIVNNSHRIQLKNISNLILDTLHDTLIHETTELIKLLKKIRSLGIDIIIFDQDQNLIKIGSLDDLISTNDHLEIIINSLVCKKNTYVENLSNDAEVKSDANMENSEHDFTDSNLLRVPVWLELHPDGSLVVVATNIPNNQRLLKNFNKESLAISR
jgi:hypothetical protein